MKKPLKTKDNKLDILDLINILRSCVTDLDYAIRMDNRKMIKEESKRVADAAMVIVNN